MTIAVAQNHTEREEFEELGRAEQVRNIIHWTRDGKNKTLPDEMPATKLNRSGIVQ